MQAVVQKGHRVDVERIVQRGLARNVNCALESGCAHDVQELGHVDVACDVERVAEGGHPGHVQGLADGDGANDIQGITERDEARHRQAVAERRDVCDAQAASDRCVFREDEAVPREGARGRHLTEADGVVAEEVDIDTRGGSVFENVGPGEVVDLALQVVNAHKQGVEIATQQYRVDAQEDFVAVLGTRNGGLLGETGGGKSSQNKDETEISLDELGHVFSEFDSIKIRIQMREGPDITYFHDMNMS